MTFKLSHKQIHILKLVSYINVPPKSVLSLSVCLSLCLSLSVCRCLCLSVCLLPVCFSLSLCPSVYLSLSVSISTSFPNESRRHLMFSVLDIHLADISAITVCSRNQSYNLLLGPHVSVQRYSFIKARLGTHRYTIWWRNKYEACFLVTSKK